MECTQTAPIIQMDTILTLNLPEMSRRIDRHFTAFQFLLKHSGENRYPPLTWRSTVARQRRLGIKSSILGVP